MDPTIESWNTKRWERCRERVTSAAQQSTESVLLVCESLLSEWSCTGEQLLSVLEVGVAIRELDSSLPEHWRMHLQSMRLPVTGAKPQPAEELATLPSCPLPLPLHRYVVAIERFGRKQGGAAIEVGKQLCDAQRVCSQAAYRFADFLDYVKQNYGLSRSTCYLYMKYHQWELPNVLGSAVMKWIVQGFQPGSPDAQTVIEAAVSEGLTLAALSTRFGHLRDQVQIGTSKSADGTNQKIIQRLTKQEQRLRAKQREIERRLEGVTRRLRQLQLGLPDGQDSSALTHHIDVN